MGKTFATFLIIKRMLEKDSTRKTIVIVPTEQLQQQWQVKAKKEKIKNIEVYVINGVTINQINLQCHLLVLDEVHKFASEIFYRIFDLVEYKWILGLTATINRMDGKHDLLIEKAPVVDTITLAEAKREGWVSDYLEYNLGIDLTPTDRVYYDKLNKDFNRIFAQFGHDFHLAMSCMKKDGAERYANQNSGVDAKQIAFYANRFNFLMQERKRFLYRAECKLVTALEIIKSFPVKTVTFSESTDFADRLTSDLGNIAVCYHSNLETQERAGKKFGKTKLKREAITRFADNRYRVRVINTAKALDQGFDVEDIELAIITSSTTNPTQHVQRVGRAVRAYIKKDGSDKIALIINIYIKDTQDEKWLKARQKDAKTKRPINPYVIWIDNLNEISYGRDNVSEITTLSVTDPQNELQ